MEETLVLVKGDGVRRRLVGEIIRRIEAKGLDIVDMKLMDVGTELAEEHYAEHREKPFFDELVEFITATPVVAMRIGGEGSIKAMRTLMGATNPAEAAPGTIRGDLALSMPDNLVHASESPRRVNLLQTAGYEFETRKSGFPELVLEDPVETVKANARGKALAVARDPDTVVLAADTIVYLPDLPTPDRILGQARNKQDVQRFINLLQGRAHEVYTGIAVARGEDLASRHAVTRVRMRALSITEVDSYARYGEGIGKAGGYAVQGRAASFVEWIGGGYTNVVGLPLALTGRMLANAGIPHP